MAFITCFSFLYYHVFNSLLSEYFIQNLQSIFCKTVVLFASTTTDAKAADNGVSDFQRYAASEYYDIVAHLAKTIECLPCCCRHRSRHSLSFAF